MPGLLSGKTLRSGGSNTYIDLKTAQPQLPATDTTTTGYTVVTDSKLVTSYRSSLGNLEIHLGEIYNNIPNGNITLSGTGTGIVFVSSSTQSVSTDSGALVVAGGVGIGGALWTAEDININGLTIGQGYKGLNNIVVRGIASDLVSEFNDGQESIVIGYDSLQGLSSSYKNIAIGRLALSSGTDISSSIAIGDSALKLIGTIHSIPVGTIVSVSKAFPVVLTVTNHGLASGTKVTVTNAQGTVELNDQTYYADVLTASKVALYTDDILSAPLNGLTYSSYISGGVLSRVIDKISENTAVGVNAGSSLIEGEQNFFFGVNNAKNLTTGSYNMFFGHDVGNNMITGNANISIGGDNLVDGLDNQINIGSLLYYNGTGYTQINSDVGLGVGTTASSISYAALTVSGGIGVTDNLLVGGQVNIKFTATSISSSTGALVVDGGAGIVKDLYVGGTITPSWGSANRGIIFPSNPGPGTGDGASIKYYIAANTLEDTILELKVSDNYGDEIQLTASGAVRVTSGVTSTSTNTGAFQVTGGVGITRDTYIGGDLTVVGSIYGSVANLAGGEYGGIPYQTGTGSTSFLAANSNGANAVLVSGGDAPFWINLGDITAGTSANAENIFVNAVSADTSYYLGLTSLTGDFSPVSSDSLLAYNTANNQLTVDKLHIASTASSTSTTTGALTVVGGIGVTGSIYSKDGAPGEGYLLYTPTTTVSATQPTAPRLGDFWIDNTTGILFQRIDDGGTRLWVQLTSAN